MDEFSQHVSMFEGAVKGGTLSDEDILQLFEMTYQAYSGKSCFKEFWKCSELLRDRKPNLFRKFAAEQIKKHESPELTKLIRGTAAKAELTVGTGISFSNKLKSMNLPTCLAAIIVHNTMLIRGEKLRERLESQGREAMLTSHLLTTDTPIQG